MLKKINAELTNNSITDMESIFFEHKIKVKCPQCSYDINIDFSNEEYEYIVQQPAKHETTRIYFSCENCEEIFYFRGVIKSVKVEIDYDDEIRKAD